MCRHDSEENGQRVRSVLNHVRPRQTPLLPELLQTLRELHRKATESIYSEDFEATARIGNNISSAAAAFRIYPISDVGKEIEAHGQMHTPISGLLNHLARLLDRMEEEIERPQT